MKEITCCFTGHRPAKLPWGYEERGAQFRAFLKKLERAIIDAIERGYTHFISGGAMGFDMISAEMVLKLKKKYKNITLECALPCFNQTNRWNEAQVARYEKILEQADCVNYVSKRYYFNGCMAVRNAYMLECSSLVIACVVDEKSGAGGTLLKAQKMGLEIVNIGV
ncbi:MAG: DUF1273 family protein [Clostridia bacterium]|nr:DUF1273 family protein [Clostridia bacterium]